MSQAAVPAIAADYFGISTHPAISDHPIVTHEFTAEKGWIRTGFRKRISPSWARKLKKQGVTAITLSLHGRNADFLIVEVTR